MSADCVCPLCDGLGELPPDGDLCPVCSGSGTVESPSDEGDEDLL